MIRLLVTLGIILALSLALIALLWLFLRSGKAGEKGTAISQGKEYKKTSESRNREKIAEESISVGIDIIDVLIEVFLDLFMRRY